MRKDFSNIKYTAPNLELKNSANENFVTAEQIELKSIYTVDDTKAYEHLNLKTIKKYELNNRAAG